MSAAGHVRLGVLLSGSGTTLQNLLDLAAAGRLPAEVVKVVSSRRDAYGLQRAALAGVPVAAVRRLRGQSVAEFSAKVWAELEPAAPDLVLFAGFMVQLDVPERWVGRVMNVHPALLPAFGGKGMYGHFVHEAVLAHGCKVTGATVHFVNNEYDRGPIILQKAVEVREDDTPDTLAARVQAAEREIYPQAVRLFAAGRLRVEGARVRVLPEAGD